MSKYVKFFVPLIIILISIGIILYLTRIPNNDPKAKNEPHATATTITSIPVKSPVVSDSPVSPIPASTPSEESPLDTMFTEGLQTYEQGDYIRAREIFDTMLNLNPNSARAYDARGTVYTALNEIDNALNDYSKAIELDPIYPPAYYNRGRIYSQLKKYDNAIFDLQRAAELAPFYLGYRANGNIGLIYHQMGEYEKALEAFGESIALNQDERADVYFFRGETYTALENYEAAIADYQAAIERYAPYDSAYQSLGYAYYKTEQFDEALDALNKALDIAPNSPTPHFYLGLVALAQQQPGQARAEISQAVDSLDALNQEQQSFLVNQVLSDLEALAQENPGQSQTIETLIDLIPKPQ